MRYLTSIVLVLFFTKTVTSQTYDVGLMVGGSNYIGDVGSTTYIAPNDIAIGAIAKWNRSKRHAFRASFLYAEITGDDSQSDDSRRKNRGVNGNGFNFKNSIKELSLGMEFTFWEWYLYDGAPQFTPYLYTGITGISYSGLAKVPATDEIESYRNSWGMAIPMVVGIKKSFGSNWVLGAEIGARYTFTDNLDGSNPTGGLSDREDLKFGNLDNNDWYVFTGITITYTWGRIPCYCVF